MEREALTVGGRTLSISYPHKYLWPEVGVTKRDYVDYLVSVAPVMLPYATNRLLMMWRYPDGVGTKRIEEKAVPGHAPEWLPRSWYTDKHWLLVNDAATLAWLGNYAALELHVPFDRVDCPGFPTELVFDLDPPDDTHFDLVLEVACRLKAVLDSLQLQSYPKTSGQTGLQIHVPLHTHYSFPQARAVNRFIAHYVAQTMPEKVTLERAVRNRGDKLYFDYLQLWKMRSMPLPYSTRATAEATVAAPLTWGEIERGVIRPSDFTVHTMPERLQQVGNLFAPVTEPQGRQSLDAILHFLKTKAVIQ